MKNILYIITPLKFLKCFTDFIVHKESLGFTVKISTVESIGSGTYDDIKKFLDVESDKIQDNYYVLLGGDANSVPGFKGNYSGRQRTTDSGYALYNSATKKYWRSIGRFPANNESELSVMCNTTIQYEVGHNYSYKNGLLMIAATNNNIYCSKNNIAPILSSSGFSNLSEFYTDSITKNDIITKIQGDKPGVINYMGHGQSDAWRLKISRVGKNPTIEYISSADVAQLGNKCSIIISWACSTANIDQGDSLGSSFLRNGAVSFWGACDISLGLGNRNMATLFWNNYIAAECPSHIGELYLKIYERYYEGTRGCLKYMLLGDPTLQIK